MAICKFVMKNKLLISNTIIISLETLCTFRESNYELHSILSVLVTPYKVFNSHDSKVMNPKLSMVPVSAGPLRSDVPHYLKQCHPKFPTVHFMFLLFHLFTW
jgi:hypothetical protein